MADKKIRIEKRTLESLLCKAKSHIVDAQFAYDERDYSSAVTSCVALIHILGNQLGEIKPNIDLNTRINESLDLIRISVAELGRAEIDTSETYDQVYRVMQFLENPELLKSIHMPLKAESLLHIVLGNLCFKEHDYESAESNYRASLDIRPTSADIVRFKQRHRVRIFKKSDFNTRYVLAAAYLQHAEFLTSDLSSQINTHDLALMQDTVALIKNKLSLAASTFREVIATDRRRKVRRDARIKLGYVHLKQLELYSSYPRFLHEKFPEAYARRYAERAEALFKQELAEDDIKRIRRFKAFKYKSAEERINKLVFKDPNINDLHYYLGSLYMSKFLGTEEQACEHFRAVASDSENYSDARVKLGIALSKISARKKELPDEAINVLENLIDSEPNTDAMVQVGRLYSDTGDYERALKYYGKAYAIAFKSSDNQKLILQSLVGLWTCHRRQIAVGDPDSGIKHRRAASRIMEKIVQVHERVGDLDAVIKKCGEMIDTGNKHEVFDALETLEMCYMRKGYLEEILKPINDSIVADPENPGNYFERGMLLYTLGNYTEAATDFNRALNRNMLSGGSLDEVADLCMLGCSYMNSGRRAHGHNMLKRALVKAYKLPDIDNMFRRDSDQSRQVFTLTIDDVLSFKIKRGIDVAEEYAKSYFLHQKLDKKSLISEPVALIRHRGEPHFVTLTLHGNTYVDALKSADSDTVRRYAVKAIAMMARLHHEVNFGADTASKIFPRTDSAAQVWANALFDCRRYPPLSQFTKIDRYHDAWSGLERCAKSLDELLYGANVDDALLYGKVQGDCHCGNIIDVARLDYDPNLQPRYAPYVSFIDNDQAHYDLFLSDVYDFLEDVRNGIHRTGVDKQDLVRLYFLFRKSLNDSKTAFKQLLGAAMTSDRKEFMPFVNYYGGAEEYVDLYKLYCHVRDAKTFGMFRAYEACETKSPDEQTANHYRQKSSQMLRNLVNTASNISNLHPGLRSIKNVWLHYINKGGLGDYLTLDELPCRPLRSMRPYSSLMHIP